VPVPPTTVLKGEGGGAEGEVSKSGGKIPIAGYFSILVVLGQLFW